MTNVHASKASHHDQSDRLSVHVTDTVAKHIMAKYVAHEEPDALSKVTSICGVSAGYAEGTGHHGIDGSFVTFDVLTEIRVTVPRSPLLGL